MLLSYHFYIIFFFYLKFHAKWLWYNFGTIFAQIVPKTYKYHLCEQAIKNPETLEFTDFFKDFGISHLVTPTGIEPVKKLLYPLILLNLFFIWYNFGSNLQWVNSQLGILSKLFYSVKRFLKSSSTTRSKSFKTYVGGILMPLSQFSQVLMGISYSRQNAARPNPVFSRILVISFII